MAQGTARRSTRKTDPLDRVKRATEKATERELKRVDTLTEKLKRDSATRLAELGDEREKIENMREALGLDRTPARRGRPRASSTNGASS